MPDLERARSALDTAFLTLSGLDGLAALVGDAAGPGRSAQVGLACLLSDIHDGLERALDSAWDALRQG